MTNAQADPPRQRKEEILDVATTLFAERGYEGTSMSDVASRVGMRKASLFYHFATKDALYEAVLDRLVSSIAQPLAAAYSGAGAFPDRLAVAVDAVVTALSDRRFVARLLLRETLDWGPVMRGKLADRVMLVLEATAAFLKAGQDAGDFVDGDPRQLTLTAVGAHLLPFALGQLVEKYVGVDALDPGFVAARRTAMRAEMRDMIVRPQSRAR